MPSRAGGRTDFSVLLPEPFGPANIRILGVTTFTRFQTCCQVSWRLAAQSSSQILFSHPETPCTDSRSRSGARTAQQLAPSPAQPRMPHPTREETRFRVFG